MRLFYFVVFFLLIYVILKIKKAHRQYKHPNFGLSPEDEERLQKQLKLTSSAKVINLEEYKRKMGIK